MESQRNEQPRPIVVRPRASFLEERNQFRQSIEMAHRMQARVAELTQEINMLWHEIYAAKIEMIALRNEIERQWVAIDQPLIGSQFLARQETPDPVCPEPAASHAVPPEELYLFLLALSDLEEKYGFNGELQYALQQELEACVRHRKSWLPPKSN